ncbi:MAG: hypothetical protein ACJA0Q_000884 [Saprospiraceae bacterium]|jgi:hypothetical protein
MVSQVLYSSESILVGKQVDSLGAEYGALSKAQKEVFVKTITNYSVELFSSDVLDRNDVFESYLNSLAKKLNPDFNKKVYLYKEAYANAFTTFRGNVFVHWGLIADAENEASLAYTMGHELGHFEGAHLYRSFISVHNATDLNRDDEIKKWHHEQAQEYYCDSLGFVLAAEAGFGWKYGMSVFYEYLSMDTIFNELEKKGDVFNSNGELINESYYDDNSDTLFSSHPPTLSRINLRKRMGKGVGNGSAYVTDKSTFKKLQTHARLKVLNQFLNSKEYKYGLIKAFKYYCLEPSNKQFKYYLIEFIRRKYHNSSSVLKRGFLSDVFHLKPGKSIYDNLRWVFRNKSDLIKVKKLIIPTLFKKGNTYLDVVSSLNASSVAEYPEFYLSMALFHHKDEKLKNYYVSKYLKLSEIKFQVFAQAYQNDELLYALRGNSNSLLVFGGVERSIRSSEGVYEDSKGSTADKEGSRIIKYVERKGRRENWECVSLKSLGTDANSNFIKNNLLPYLYAKAYSEEEAGGLRISGMSSEYLISPELWMFMNDKKYTTIATCYGYSLLDKEVSMVANFKSHFKSLGGVSFHATSNYYNVARNSYVFRWIKLKSSDFSVESSEERVKSKLTNNALRTEIILKLK